MPRPNRRQFLGGCSAAIASLAGARFGNFAFASGAETNEDLLVIVFLQGGIDGLNLIPPISGADRGHYEASRPNIAIPTSGSSAAFNLNGQFGLHPAAPHLRDLYQDGKLSVVLSTGMFQNNRSHFDSMRYMELGTPGELRSDTGWLTRHLNSATNLPAEILIPGLAMGNVQNAALLGAHEAINIGDPDDFTFNTGHSEWRSAQRTSLRRILNDDDTWLHQRCVDALDALDTFELNVIDDYHPANGVEYPNTSLGEKFETIAQMTKLGLGLRVATVELGGWDTHNSQGDGGGGNFASNVEDLSEVLSAFYEDLDEGGNNNYANKTTIVVMSEFGRRLKENADRGTDHGHGNMMLVLSGEANGGVHGAWPGLADEALFDGADLEVMTDYRRVLAEILIRRLGNPNLGDVFPGYTNYEPLGVVNGTDLTPIYGPEIFNDGFETGNSGLWI